jgi:hypothetical protein
VREFYESEEPELTRSVNSSAKLEEEVIKAILDKPLSEQTVEDREK